MLNPFPELLVYGILSPFMLRVAVGTALFYLAVHHYREREGLLHLLSPLVGKLSRIAMPAFVIVEVLAAGAFIVGAYTQIAAIVACSLFLKSSLVKSRLTALAPLSHTAYLLLFIISLSLLFSGAGGFAFDLPL